MTAPERIDSLLDLWQRLAVQPPEVRDPAPFLSALATAVAGAEPRRVCRDLAVALQRRGLPAPAPDALEQAMGRPGTAPQPVPAVHDRGRPRFAFVMANRNDAKWLRRSLPALCGQSRPADQILVIDDASDDDSPAILEAFRAQHPNFAWRRNERNMGPCAAIRAHWHLVTADYVIFAAADDLVSRDFLAQVEPLARQHPEAGAIHGTTLVWFQQDDRTVMNLPLPQLRSAIGYHDPGGFRRLLLGSGITIDGNVACFRRAAIDAAGMFDPDLDHVADTFLFQQVVLSSGICYLEAPLGTLTRHDGQLSVQGMRDRLRRAAANGKVLDRWAMPGHAAYRQDVLRHPALLENFPGMGADLAWRPEHWDLLVAHASWASQGAAGITASLRLLGQEAPFAQPAAPAAAQPAGMPPSRAADLSSLQYFYASICGMMPTTEIQAWLQARMQQSVRNATAAAGIPPAPPASPAVMEPLHRDGHFIIGQVLPPAVTAQLREASKALPVFNGEMYARSDRVKRSWDESRRQFRLAGYRITDILKLPHLLELANDPRLMAVVEAYLGCCPTIAMMSLWWSFPTKEARAALPTRLIGQEFHRDQDDFRGLTLFAYLTDVDPRSGAQRYIRGSHDPVRFRDLLQTRVPPGERPLELHETYQQSGLPVGPVLERRFPDLIATVTGPAGTVFLADTGGLHHGSPLQEGMRLLFVVRYGLSANQNRMHLTDYVAPPFEAFRHRLPDDARTRYVNRVLLG